jgi:hypothetical protein
VANADVLDSEKHVDLFLKVVVMVMAPQASEDRSRTNFQGSSDVIFENQRRRKCEAFGEQHC